MCTVVRKEGNWGAKCSIMKHGFSLNEEQYVKNIFSLKESFMKWKNSHFAVLR
jgi:hypothetical protein